jgi:hypothetical protein
MMSPNNIVDNVDTNNYTLYYVQQFRRKIFKRIPSKIRKNAQYINIFTYNIKSYHVDIGININLIDDYQKYKWKSPVLNIEPNSDIISFDYINCKLILNENVYQIIDIRSSVMFLRIPLMYTRTNVYHNFK